MGLSHRMKQRAHTKKRKPQAMRGILLAFHKKAAFFLFMSFAARRNLLLVHEFTSLPNCLAFFSLQCNFDIMKQLFGESECKEGKGVIPMSLQMSTDLHSMGQFLQEGRQIFFETTLTVEHICKDVSLEKSQFAGVARTMRP